MSDDDELHVLGHLPNQLRKAQDVSVIKRCINLIEQANRARIEMENGENQRHRCHSLLATREQLHTGIALSRGSRHQRNARIKQILPCQFQIGVSSAENFRKQFAEPRVHSLKRFLESLPGFPVYFPNRSDESF